MKTKRTFPLFLLLTMLLAACATLEAGIENPTDIMTVIADQLPTATTADISVVTDPTQPSDSPTETALPTEPPQPTASGSPYAGLIYRLGDELFRIDPTGAAVAVAPGVDPQMLPGQFTPRAAVSPDGQQMISWWDWSDLWMVDLATGQTRNVTNTSESEECCAQFWSARPDTLVFLTRSPEDVFSYKVAAVNVDGSDYHILDDANPLFGMPALSSDGNTIAYDAPAGPLLYRWGLGTEAFTPANYDQPLSELSSPSWLPDGLSLGWMTSGNAPGSLTIFDLQANTYRAIHAHTPVGGEGGLLAPVWSPDGDWVAVFDHSVETPGVWVMHPDGSGEVRVYQPATMRSVSGLQAFWSPSSQRLLVADPNAEGGTRLTLINLPSGQTEPSPLPEGAIPLAWVR